MTPRCFKCSQFRKDTLDFNFESIKMLQNDFCKQRYIILNATTSGQDRIYPKIHLCRTLLLSIYASLKSFIILVVLSYSPYTILWKPPFCISPYSKTPTYKYYIVNLLHSKSRKKCHKNFENRFINKNLMPKNDLDQVFYMCKGGNPKILNLEF